MSIPCQRIRVALMSILCAAALLLPVWAAYAVEARPEAITPAPESDALFYGYLLQRAGASNHANLLSDAASKLSTKDRELYDRLKAFVAKIASGEETEAVYTIVYDDFQKTWTAAELGVSDIFSTAGAEALSAKIDECYNYNTDVVMDALLADCPYELYWYSKSDGGVHFGYEGAAYSGNSKMVTLTSTPTFTVSMSVSPDYGSGTTVDRSLRPGIENTVANAKAIVDTYKGKSDYKKLLGYSTEICELVTYDTDAAKNKNTPYGDPWQLISVFDGDPDTNVVCEGYAKAFKYLCDLTTFNSPKVECCLVTGLLGGGTGAGDHMWNVVTMDNGRRYLVDVTNSDSNGGPEYLLLKGGTPHSQNSAQYNFYGWLAFVYDGDTRNLWGDEFLTLDTVDYKDAEQNPGQDPDPGEESDPGTPSAYAYEVRGVTRSGANLTVKLQNNAGSGALLILAAYTESGQFLRAALDSTQTANIEQGTSGGVTVQLDTGDADTLKVILLDSDTQKPLCQSDAYMFQ